MASRSPAESRSQDNVSLLLGLAAITERFEDGYIASVVRRALDSRGQVSDDARNSLDAAIVTSEVRVQGGGFRPQNVNRAPSYQLQAPVHARDEPIGGTCRSRPENLGGIPTGITGIRRFSACKKLGSRPLDQTLPANVSGVSGIWIPGRASGIGFRKKAARLIRRTWG